MKTMWLKCFLFFLLSAVAFTGMVGAGSKIDRRFYDVASQDVKSAGEVLPELMKNRIILVGEHHTTPGHHAAQLAVIRMLHEAGVKVVVGLEMFRDDSQSDLDGWLAKTIDEDAFRGIFYDNWGYDWPLYRDIFVYAMDNGIPMAGLNVPRDITRQVAQKGYKSLSDEQLEKLGDVTCRVDKEYMEFIRRAYGGHGHGDMRFLYFCEAQMVWDNAMAVHALAYLKAHPERVMVLLAGTGHVRKQAVPAQIKAREDIPVAVILPETPGTINEETIDIQDADYLILD